MTSGRVGSARLFVIDTSSIIEPRRLLSRETAAERNRVYRALGALVEEGRLFFPSQVYEELERWHDVGEAEDLPFEWACAFKGRATAAATPDELFVAVRAVLNEVDNLVDFDKVSPADDADPWVVGLALHLAQAGHSVSVITEDRSDRDHKTSMVSACGALELPAMSVRMLLKHLGVWPNKT
jgi:hypothetical protein